MIFETHAHYDDEAFEEDREALLGKLTEKGIGAVINAGSSLESLKKIAELTEKYPFIYGAVGIHPCDTGELIEENLLWMKERCKDKKTVAVGEIGLDYHWKEPEAEIQKQWFIRQLILAQEVSLPVIIHSREAAKDTLDIMKTYHAEKTGGVIHCFSYGKEMAEEFGKLGFYFGIGGVVTFQNARKLLEALEVIPMEKIVLETDSPYLAPVPHRGERNSSLYLPYIIEKISEIKSISVQEVTDITRQNAERLFGIRCEGGR